MSLQRAWGDGMTDPREAEWLQHEAAQLAAGRCPASGLVLHMEGEGPQGSASCDMCDCFGYNPDEVKVHPRPLNVARWKVTRKTCGICKHGFGDDSGSSICPDCLGDALGLTIPGELFTKDPL